MGKPGAVLFNTVFACLIGVGAALGVVPRLDHGGCSVESDVWLIKVDRYWAHCTGYLPRGRAAVEFCEGMCSQAGCAVLVVTMQLGQTVEVGLFAV